MDLPDETEQSDSGMESLTASKDDTPERRPEDIFITPVVRQYLYIKNNDKNVIFIKNVTYRLLELRLPLVIHLVQPSKNMMMYVLFYSSEYIVLLFLEDNIRSFYRNQMKPYQKDCGA